MLCYAVMNDGQKTLSNVDMYRFHGMMCFERKNFFVFDIHICMLHIYYMYNISTEVALFSVQDQLT